jgi:Ca2+:H+ antiporter
MAYRRINLGKPSLDWLLVLVPVAAVCDYVLHNELLTFLTAAGAIIPLAGLIGRATEQLALHAGPRMGGLLNATFGNVAELIIAFFLILDDELDVVLASLTGSIIGNLLLVLGLSLLLGGIKHKEQHFSAAAAGVHSTSLMLAVAGLLMPALFVLTTHSREFVERETVSIVVALVLMAMYGFALLFTMVTHEHLFHIPTEHEEPEWPKKRAVGILLGATAVTAWMSEMLVGALEPALADLGLSKFFVGLIVIPLIGNAAEHSSAVVFALKNRLDITLEIAIGSSVQIALFVAPVLVFISLAVGHPMSFLFSPFEIAAVALSAMLVSLVSRDGESNWLEGAQLLGTYVIMAISFFFVQEL